jgi:uncharacterized protein DUF5681
MARNPSNPNSGHRDPSHDTRFKKGQSGNPAGRPKKVSSFKDDLTAELQEKLVVVENGKERRVTKQKAFAKTLIAAAIKKDTRAVNALLACMKFFGVGGDQTLPEAADIDDLDLVEKYLVQQRKKQSRADLDADTNLRARSRKRRSSVS